LLVQRTDLSVEEELLVLLHYAGELGFSRSQLGQYALRPAPRITEALQRLQSASVREVVHVAGTYRLTGLGAKRVREELGSKLVLE
jgi:hypothetical protein